VKNERLMKIILSPLITEKAVVSAEVENTYALKVAKDANKGEIKRAVELMFDVSVDDVRTMNVRGKVKRHGARLGRRASWKKAIVKIAEGDSINEIIGVE
jgi:large subunit ribosomal protein L23